MRTRSTRKQHGSAMVTILVSTMMMSALCAAVVTVSSADLRRTQADITSERALQLAEAGVDWAITQIRINQGTVPTAPDTRAVASVGTYTVRYAQGDANGSDDDGNGTVDEPGEQVYATALCTGTCRDISRTVRVLLKRAVEVPEFTSILHLESLAPTLDLNGAAFEISGEEHFIDGTVDKTRPASYAISSLAPTTTLVTQIDSKNANQIKGLGGPPSVGTSESVQLDEMLQDAEAAATVVIPAGTTTTTTSLGDPATGVTVIAYCPGDLHLSGGLTGAGLLAVDGDLVLSGGFNWVGIVLVRGRLVMTGSGGTKKVTGALATGEETDADATKTSGRVRLGYSSDAIDLAAEQLSAMTIATWREVGNPAP